MQKRGEIITDTSIAFVIGPFTVRWYGIIISLAILFGIVIAAHLAKKMGEDTDDLINIALIAVPLAILGARLYYVAFNWDFYSQNPAEILKTWHGGMAIHGAVLAGILVVFFYTKMKDLCFRRWLDILCVPLILGQAVGRWGNFFNQEAYGYETNMPWAMYIDGAYRHPTFLYESLRDLAVFLLLLYIFKKCRYKTGDLAACYLVGYSLGRFFIEQLRTDSLMMGPIRVAVFVSFIGILAGIVLFYLNRKFEAPKKNL